MSLAAGDQGQPGLAMAFSGPGLAMASPGFLWLPWTRDYHGKLWLSLATLGQGLPWPALAVLGRRRPKTPRIGFGGGDMSHQGLPWPALADSGYPGPRLYYGQPVVDCTIVL